MGAESWHLPPVRKSWQLEGSPHPAAPLSPATRGATPGAGASMGVEMQPAGLRLAQTGCVHSFRCLKPISGNKLVLAFGINYHIFLFPVCRLNAQL